VFQLLNTFCISVLAIALDFSSSPAAAVVMQVYRVLDHGVLLQVRVASEYIVLRAQTAMQIVGRQATGTKTMSKNSLVGMSASQPTAQDFRKQQSIAVYENLYL